MSGSAVIALMFYAVRHQDLEQAMFALIAGCLIRIVGGSVIVLNVIGWRQIACGLPFELTDAARVFNCSLPMFLVSIISSSGPWAVGRIVASGEDGDYAMALFAIGLQWFSLGMFLSASVSRLTLPRLLRSIENPRADNPAKDHIYRGLKLAVGSSLLVSCFGAASVVLNRP